MSQFQITKINPIRTKSSQTLTLTRIFTANKYPPGESWGQKERIHTMKMNKIALKKIRIEYLETVVDRLEREIGYAQRTLESAKESLSEAVARIVAEDDERAVQDRDNDIAYYKQYVESLEIKVQEGNKLLAELEKMV